MADLALQMLTWPNPVGDLIAMLSGHPDTALCLLDVFTVLPEEVPNDFLALSVPNA